MSNTFRMERKICDSCNDLISYEIGVAAAGWAFQFNGYIECRLKNAGFLTIISFRQFVEVVEKEGWVIYDEYDKEYSLEEFKDYIETFKDGRNYYGDTWWEDRDRYVFNLRNHG